MIAANFFISGAEGRTFRIVNDYRKLLNYK